MKKTLLAISFSLILSFTASAQSVVNTIWLGHDSTNTPDLYWNFTTDSLRFSSDNITYTTISSYVEQANILRIVDINTGPGVCPATDTGIYIKVFSNDTMWLNLFSDPCTSRLDYLTTHYFLNMSMNVNEQVSPKFTVYPNPAHSNCQVNCERIPSYYRISTIDGKLLETVQTNSAIFPVDFSAYPAGIYLLTIVGESGSGTQRVVVN